MRKIIYTLISLFTLTLCHAQTTNPAPYCHPVIDPSGGQLYNRITNFHLGSINNSSNTTSAGNAYYTYYNNIAAATLAADSSYALTISVYKNDAEMDEVIVYADYNHDNHFDSSEIVFNNNTIVDSTPNTGATYTLRGRITIPHTASGGATRLRAIFTDTVGGTATPPFAVSACFNNGSAPGTGDYGDVEDYNITVTAAVVTGLSSMPQSALHIYPNPARDHLAVQGAETVLEATIYTTLGQVVSMQRLDSSHADISLAGMPQGLYILDLAAGDTHHRQIFRVE